MNRPARIVSVAASLFALLAAGCSGHGDPADPDATSPSDVPPDGDGGPGPISCAPEPFAWPTGAPATLTPHESWAETIPFGYGPFVSDGGLDTVWVKFTILLDGEPRVVFQDGNTYVFHSDFARERLAPFVGLSRDEVDALTLHRDGQLAIFGTVLMSGFAERYEIGVQLIGVDPYPAELVSAALALVAEAVDSGDAPLDVFYMPTGEQARVASICADRFEAEGVKVSSTERWTGGLGCYSDGWAVGRLVAIEGAAVKAAFEAGELTTDDILLTRDVPAELPPVAGIVTTTASSSSSHVAILASTYGAPYALMALEEDVSAAQALVGRTVALSASSESVGGRCVVRLLPIDHLDAALLDEIVALGAPGPLAVPAKTTSGALVLEVDDLGPADIVRVGGKAANYGVLRDTIPASVRPAKALTFDLWDAYMARPHEGGTLGGFIAGRLAGHTWPVDVRALGDDLRDIRDAIEDDVDFDADDKATVEAALGGFDATRPLRFRSSTNVEDSDSFTGAGLYESKSGCLADDTDGDGAGPSRCDASEGEERGIWRAIRKVYASFYSLNATIERLRHGVDEAEVGMGVLVHHSFPDVDELANGVGLGTWSEEDGAQPWILASQVGATSVANPDPGVLPELTVVRAGGNFTSVRTLQPSSLLPLGARVLADDDAYLALGELLNAVRDAMRALYPGEPLRLDLEYKLERTEGLVVKQVRRVPARDREATLPTFLVDDGPVRLCTFQGEFGDVFANHRLKSRWTIGVDDRWLSEAGLATSFLDEVAVEIVAGGERTTLTGPASSWPGATHASGEGYIPSVAWTQDTARPEGFAGTLTLTATVFSRAPTAQGPIQPLSAQDFGAQAAWDGPRLTLSNDGEATIGLGEPEDGVRLGACPEDTPDDVDDEPQTRVFAGEGAADGVGVTTRYVWPPGPTGASGGYTAPLKRWVETTITGLTGAPIVLTSWFAQTYRPEHHNFAEHFVFEPRLDPGVDAATLAELDALGVVMIYTYGSRFDDVSSTVRLFDADGNEVSLP